MFYYFLTPPLAILFRSRFGIMLQNHPYVPSLENIALKGERALDTKMMYYICRYIKKTNRRVYGTTQHTHTSRNTVGLLS